MSLFKKNKKVPPLTREEEDWLIWDRIIKQMDHERQFFSSEEEYRDFVKWRYKKKGSRWDTKPDNSLRDTNEDLAWIVDYYFEHPEKKMPEIDD